MSKYDQIIGRYQLRLSTKLKELDIPFNNLELYIQAFSHSSFINDFKMDKKWDNERLEFLGDAVLELAVSQYLYRRFGDLPEGRLTKLRAAIVCEPSLVTFANALNFQHLLLLGKGEEKTGGRSRPSLISDAFEAFLGALYLDLGFEKSIHFFEKYIFPEITEELMEGVLDFKTYLQELIHQKNNVQVTYRLIEEKGPAHFKSFTSEVLVSGEVIGTGTGRTKKESEQQAAKSAISELTAGD